MITINEHSLENKDRELIKFANAEFERTKLHERHGVASAVILRSGEMFVGLVLETEVPSLTICAEPIVIGKVLDKIDKDPIQTIVAVRHEEQTNHKVIPPCGRCREFITDYAPTAKVIIYDKEDDNLIKIVASDLLPFKCT